MSNRKQHNNDAGYIAERMNPHVKGSKVVIYEAKQAGIDVDDVRYAIVCDAHGAIAGDSSLPRARLAMKAPENFCDDCLQTTTPTARQSQQSSRVLEGDDPQHWSVSDNWYEDSTQR